MKELEILMFSVLEKIPIFNKQIHQNIIVQSKKEEGKVGKSVGTIAYPKYQEILKKKRTKGRPLEGIFSVSTS